MLAGGHDQGPDQSTRAFADALFTKKYGDLLTVSLVTGPWPALSPASTSRAAPGT